MLNRTFNMLSKYTKIIYLSITVRFGNLSRTVSMSLSISVFHYSIFRGKIMLDFLNYLNAFFFYAQSSDPISMSQGRQKLKLFLWWVYVKIFYLRDNLQREYTKCLFQALNIQTEKVKTLRKK